ncbi:hypothetical protein [Prosthecomicrobium pneumaticum]|uniref:Putative membrane protein n=1 Tax=Prosthecomicrobium pneumaticum TaxID=81895 RepID=A0A7W9FLA3_9HYPH|nr:hypothetical protein [Prosthecomicrobium pneumaticum]MBB5752609.1 putative membrane protein [Prosthecomicrobium pneumaticum]
MSATPPAALPPERDPAGPPGPPPVRPPSLLGFLVTLAVFALLGPPIGGLVIIVALFLGLSNGMSEPEHVAAIIVVLAASWWMAYPLGVVPALLAGLAIGLKRLWGGGAGLVFTLATGLFIGLVIAFGVADLGGDPALHDLAIGIVAGSTIATFFCWLLTGGIGRAARLARTAEARR